jgi:hypothetical protein
MDPTPWSRLSASSIKTFSPIRGRVSVRLTSEYLPRLHAVDAGVLIDELKATSVWIAEVEDPFVSSRGEGGVFAERRRSVPRCSGILPPL